MNQWPRVLPLTLVLACIVATPPPAEAGGAHGPAAMSPLPPEGYVEDCFNEWPDPVSTADDDPLRVSDAEIAAVLEQIERSQEEPSQAVVRED